MDEVIMLCSIDVNHHCNKYKATFYKLLIQKESHYIRIVKKKVFLNEEHLNESLINGVDFYRWMNWKKCSGYDRLMV